MRRIPTQAQRNEMVRRYLDGCSLSEAAAPFGFTWKASQNALKRAGVPRRHSLTNAQREKMSQLKRGETDLTDKRFGKLVVLGWAPVAERSRKKAPWKCQCDCGNVCYAASGNLLSEATPQVSCGCHRVLLAGRRLRTHGKTGTSIYRIWKGIKTRCTLPSSYSWKWYGERGVRVCKRWAESFEAFFADMGDRPSKNHSVDRIDNLNGHYSCGTCDECRENGWSANCRWATLREQHCNTRTNYLITRDGQTLHLSEWCRRLGLPVPAVWKRLKKGWDTERALTEPVRKRGTKGSPEKRLRSLWAMMIYRCHNPKSQDYADYGGRGVYVAATWRESFEQFKVDVGPRPSEKHSLHRLNNDGPYAPGNVVWADVLTQARHRRRRKANPNRLPRQ